MKGIWLFAVAAALLGASLSTSADELLIETIRAEQGSQMQRPDRGMTMERVRANFGSPSSTRPAVGDPPITRWQYDNFTVFFEYDRVIRAVARR